MILRELASAIVIGILIIISTLGVVYSKITKQDDNQIEEAIEVIVETQLGLEPGTIDLTPGSPEKEIDGQD